MKNNYLSQRHILCQNIDIDFESSMDLDDFIKDLQAIKAKAKKDHGENLSSVYFEEVRTGYEDWYFEVKVYYYESESQFKKRIELEEKAEQKERADRERKMKIEQHNLSIDEQIKMLKKQKIVDKKHS